MRELIHSDTLDQTKKGYAVNLMILEKLLPALGISLFAYGLADLFLVKVFRIYKIEEKEQQEE